MIINKVLKTKEKLYQLSYYLGDTTHLASSIPVLNLSYPNFPRSHASTQTCRNLRSPRIEKLRQEKKNLQRQVRDLKKKLQAHKDTEKSIADRVTPEDVIDILKKHFPADMATFLVHQFNLKDVCRNGKRYTVEFKYFCLKLYFLGPKCYNLLRSFFSIPSKRTLSRLTENIKLKPGFNDEVFSTLKIKVDTLSCMEQCCVLCFDEMAIKAHLYYNITDDEVVGFEDLGKKKAFLPALNVLVMMVRGLSSNWKQPLAYFFVNTKLVQSSEV